MKIKGSGGVQCDGVSQAFQLLQGALGNGVAVALFEVMIAQVHIVLAVIDDMVADDDDAVRHRQGGAIGSDASGPAAIWGAQAGWSATGG